VSKLFDKREVKSSGFAYFYWLVNYNQPVLMIRRLRIYADGREIAAQSSVWRGLFDLTRAKFPNSMTASLSA